MTNQGFKSHFHLEDATMNENIINLVDVEYEFFNYAVIDEAVEAAAALSEGQAKNQTVAFCSGLDTCPT